MDCDAWLSVLSAIEYNKCVPLPSGLEAAGVRIAMSSHVLHLSSINNENKCLTPRFDSTVANTPPAHRSNRILSSEFPTSSRHEKSPVNGRTYRERS